MVIQLAVFLLSAGWALVSGGGYYALHRGNALEATPGLNASILGGCVFVITLFVLSFMGGILLSVLDAGKGGEAAAHGQGCDAYAQTAAAAAAPCRHSVADCPAPALHSPLLQCLCAGPSTRTARR